MQVLVVAEHDGESVREASLAALAFAQSVTNGQGHVRWLLLGYGLEKRAADLTRYAPVLVADSAGLASVVADRWAHVVAEAVRSQACELLCAAATTFAKDVVGRAAGLLGGAMASDVVGHSSDEGRLRLHRPMYAGRFLATVVLKRKPWVVTVRPTAYRWDQSVSQMPVPGEEAGIRSLTVDAATLPSGTEFERLERKAGSRPDATEARVVVSGGRAIRTADDFEQLVGRLADRLGAATGSSRALVDAGIAPNALQIGQTGKVVAPDLYLALGISGAIQHMAGMKNSRVIAAINSDPQAPIFEMADYGLVADVYEAVPELTRKLDELDTSKTGGAP
jgi:electron transfer flavoprotein alpha subunit